MQPYRTQWLDVPKGTLAFMTSFAGLVPCRVTYLRRVTFADGRQEYWADIQCTATRGAYERGMRFGLDLSRIVPRPAVHRSRQRCGQFSIAAYAWADYIPALAA